jgi:peptidoglycan/LPS O-acetylase OafA/YrhL
MPPSSNPTHLVYLDALKWLAAHLVVAHHLSAYGSLAAATAEQWPQTMGWLFNEARMAVQIFLVMGGYLAAKCLRRPPHSGLDALRVMGWRFTRLVLPYWGALVLAVLGAALARQWWLNDAIPSPPTLWQFFMHALLLQDLTHQEALSTGVWYVAIDFQLFCLITLLATLGHRWVVAGVIALTTASLFYFNLNSDWDVCGLYFFGAYGLGALAYVAASSARVARGLALLALLGGVALVVDFRGRIALALGVALWLGVMHVAWQRWPTFRQYLTLFLKPLNRFYPASYALFLIHFPVCLLGNALYVRMGWHSADVALACMGGVWLVSLGLAVVFHERVERALVRKSMASP